MMDIKIRLEEYRDRLIKNQEEYDIIFREFADYLMNRCVIYSGEGLFRICELEFYWNSPDHQDRNVHRDPEQLKCGTWYFNGFGLDISFGKDGADGKYYGGILIRGIYNWRQDEFVNGPSKILKRLLASVPVSGNKNELLQLHETDIESVTIYPARRYNLGQEDEYSLRSYSYINFLKRNHKFPSRKQLMLTLLNSKHITKKMAKECLGYVPYDTKGLENDIVY